MCVLKKFLKIFILLSIPNFAFAVGGVSRACRFDTIPNSLKPLAVKFFVALGADPAVLKLPKKSQAEQSQFYILESITTDYGRIRYWLFASSAQYSMQIRNWNFEKPHLPILFRTLNSGWTAEQVAAATQAHPEFAPFFLNRGFLYSARAGSDAIIERFSDQDMRGLPTAFFVIGRHYYFDPLAKTLHHKVSQTRAVDCNLTDWGFLDR